MEVDEKRGEVAERLGPVELRALRERRPQVEERDVVTRAGLPDRLQNERRENGLTDEVGQAARAGQEKDGWHDCGRNAGVEDDGRADPLSP